MTSTLLVLLAGLWAGTQNALAGGGSFVTLPALIVAGMSPLAANVTSTVALFPGQAASGVAARKLVTGAASLPFWALFLISLVGGAAGGVLLLHTPSKLFEHLVPWLVLFATLVFTWGSFFRKPGKTAVHIGPIRTSVAQFVIATYGGYFGGGIGFLMMAALTMAGVQTRNAAAIKNVLAGVMNASAVFLFLRSPELHWNFALIMGLGAMVGGVFGAWALQKINERSLRLMVVCIGLALTVGLFLRPL
ncbi:sulfite exporter TauE/SafE family protein [Burkholderia sp. THE68]|uniref:sulfite exporter TauE/SafE family protein n=1 Tax=Burkholderia sp. THE68 TaxID=758782 RepID=UPI00138A3D4C|nr:sulfite exporter TauE/SafE family protein [Burkholderia sp. THE68]